MTLTFSTQVTRPINGAPLPLGYQLEPKLYRPVTVAQLDVHDLQPGDLVHAYGAGQVQMPATDPPARAMHACFLKATRTESNAHTEGLLLRRPMGVNFTTTQNYSLLDATGSFVVTDAWAGTARLMLVMYAANLSGNPDDPRSLPVKYAELRADVTRVR